MKTIAVQDANILIDLIKTGLFDHCLALPFSFTTTNIIMDELIEEQAAVIEPHINSGKFSVIKITADELGEIMLLSEENTSLSEQDWSAYYYAQKKSSLLLTGDKRLRTIAESKGIIVCGILWVFDRLVENAILSEEEACTNLKILKNINKRIPQTEYEKRIKNWCK
jgi:predicted nucleic acid-binding protein